MSKQLIFILLIVIAIYTKTNYIINYDYKDESGKSLDTMNFNHALVKGLALGITSVYMYHSEWLKTSIIQYTILLIVVEVLIMVVYIDAKHRIIPDELTGILGVAGIVLLVLKGEGFKEGLIGALLITVILLITAIATKGGIGGGDIKLLAALGITEGFKGITYITWGATLGAAGFIITRAIYRRLRGTGEETGKILDMRESVPMGPFIVIVYLVKLLVY